MKIKVIMILLLTSIIIIDNKKYFAYRIKILNDDTMGCNNKTCDNRPHSSCYELTPSLQCEDFQLLQFHSNHINNLLNGHNGLRNRVAKNWKKPASNMNYLHWSLALQRMAQGWISQCIINIDSCNFIFDDALTVGQNIMFLKKLPSHKWGSSIIRSWFLEGNAIDDRLIDRFVEGRQSNYTQLIWANTEFVGCAAAKMFNGIFMVCNYHPKGNIPNKSVYKTGAPCSNCSRERPICGQIFNGLCGFDGFFTNSINIPSKLSILFLLQITIIILVLS